ncbi:MAG: 4Fe-4S ferredoxin, partial [Planctomycetia bacterium]|nr:4Fe-4S ferredoxin [Planctomycetia bacterium]
MIRFAYIVALLAVVLLHAASASAQERFPPPDFVETEHELPTTTVPAPRLGVYEYLDVGVLLASLAIASYLVLRHRSRRWIFVLMVFCLAYFGFWRQGCICPVGSLQNVVLALSDSDYSIPLVVLAFFFLPLVFTLFFGRVFCAAVC